MLLKILKFTFLGSSIILSAQAETTVNIPFKLAKGQLLYQQNCSSCHGKALEGSNKGPTFLSPIYKASHHGDEAFYRAALKGVRAHHWNFGNMPPVKDMNERKMNAIVPFIRYYQKQKGY